MSTGNQIVTFKPDDANASIEVQVHHETVWLYRNQIAELFGRDIKTIGKHINNVFKAGKLSKETTVAKYATVENIWR